MSNTQSQGHGSAMSHRGKRNSNGNAESVHSTASKTSGSIKDSSKNVPPRRFSASLKHFITAGALAIGLFVLKNSSGKNGPLPHGAYALCSPNGQNIYTVDSLNSKVQCMVVENSRIIDLGPLRDVQARWTQGNRSTSGTSTAVAHLPVRFIPAGAIVVPGLSDSHGHILEYGASRQLSLEECRDSKAAVDKLKQFILNHPDILNDRTRSIEGWGWDHTAWPAEVFPHFSELEADPIVRGRPVILQSKDGHALWVSELIMNSTGPLPDEVDGGIIVRDEMKQPTGVFLDNAQDLLKKPPLTEADRLQRFMFAVNDALAKGLTSLHDAGFNPASLAFFRSRAQLSNLPIRVYGMTFFDENADYWGNKQEKIINLNRLNARSVKIFADGALRSGGAALFEPYSDNPETRGFMRIDPKMLEKFIPKFLADGWQVNVHAIGDRANSIVLDVFESALAGLNTTQLRPRIEHAQIIRPRDMERLAKLGVIASVQPTHAVSDMWFAQDRLGPDRVKNLYAFRSIVDSGARITLGSDFPVEDLNPLAGFHAAVTRLSPENQSPHGPGGWFPQQCLSRIEALKGMTIDPAYASFSEKDLGSLEVGKIADFAVFSQDFVAAPDDEIMKAKVLATVMDGSLVYGKL